MGDFKASCRRLLAAYRGEKADRVPMGSPISWHPCRDIDKEKPGGWRADPEFIKLARMVQEYCDPMVTHNAVKRPGVFSGLGYQRFLEVSDDLVVVHPVENVGGIRRRHRHTLPTPKGDLTWTSRRPSRAPRTSRKS